MRSVIALPLSAAVLLLLLSLGPAAATVTCGVDWAAVTGCDFCDSGDGCWKQQNPTAAGQCYNMLGGISFWYGGTNVASVTGKAAPTDCVDFLLATEGHTPLVPDGSSQISGINFDAGSCYYGTSGWNGHTDCSYYKYFAPPPPPPPPAFLGHAPTTPTGPAMAYALEPTMLLWSRAPYTDTTPHGIAFDDITGSFYVVVSCAIVRVTSGGEPSVVAGTLGTCVWQDSTDGTGLTATFNTPSDIALSGDGATLWVVETSSCTVRTVNVATGATVTVVGAAGAGSCSGGPGTDGSLAQASIPILYSGQYQIALDTATGDVYLSGSNTIRMINATDISTVAGNYYLGCQSGYAVPCTDGAAASSSVSAGSNHDLLVDSATGIVYWTEPEYHVVRQLDNGVVTTVAGLNQGANSVPFSGAIDGVGPGTALRQPTFLVKTGEGELLVRNEGASNFRKLVLAGAATAVSTISTAQQATPVGMAAAANGTVYVQLYANSLLPFPGSASSPAAQDMWVAALTETPVLDAVAVESTIEQDIGTYNVSVAAQMAQMQTTLNTLSAAVAQLTSSVATLQVNATTLATACAA